MTKGERDKRWQEILDRYDQAIAEFHQSTALIEPLAPQLTWLIARFDEVAAASRRIVDATTAANRAALALYRDEHEPDGE
jgi:hypothetical protein